MKEKQLSVLITGTASGIGRAAAERFISKGHRVYAVDVKETALDGCVPFVADTTDSAALAAILAKLESDGVRLDAILCIAGVHTMTSFVEGDTSVFKRLIEINLLGAMYTVRAFHRLLAKGGRVVIVTSEVATYSPMPFNGLYSVSKTALDCYADSLRQELNLLGQTVVAVRPGATATPLQHSSLDSTLMLAESTELYKRQATHFSSLVKGFQGTPITPEQLSKTIYRATVVKRPRLAYGVHRSPWLVLMSVLPKRLQCFLVRLLLNRK